MLIREGENSDDCKIICNVEIIFVKSLLMYLNADLKGLPIFVYWAGLTI